MKAKCIAMLVTFLLLGITIATKARSGTADAPTGLRIIARDGTAVPNAHIVLGKATLPGGMGTIVTFTGIAAFSNAQSYVCFHGNSGGPIAGAIERLDGKQIRLGRISDTPITIDFVCIGN